VQLKGGAVLRASLAATAVALGSTVAGTAGADGRTDKSPEFFGPKLVRDDVRIPSRDGRYTIAATVLRPEGRGPYGAVILNHGVAGSEAERRRESASIFLEAAAVFARRGYVVVLPLRRGFGATGGEFAEDAGPCRNPNYMRAEQAASDDVIAAYDFAQRLPYVDPSRMILAGQSGGGMTSVFTAGMQEPKGLLAVLTFAAGRGGNPDLSPGVPCAVEPVAKVFDTLGKRVKAPVLFHYSSNDQYFNAETTRLWYERFSAGGAKGDYVLQPPYGGDGHYVFSELIGVRYRLPAVEKFFAKHNIPFQRLDAVDKRTEPLLVAKPPHVKTESCTGLYRVFLEAPGPRAFAVSGDGRCGFAGGIFDAREVALRQCKRVSKGGDCSLYAVNDAVVWRDNTLPETQVADAPRQASTGR
jgi:dienelactone hydrolase